MSDQIWFQNIKLLFEKEKLLQFWPSKHQSFNERINAITRFVLYNGIILSIYKKNSNAIILSVLFCVILAILAKSSKSRFMKVTEDILGKSDCQKPNLQNPMANRLPYDNINRPSACNEDSTQSEIHNKLFEQFPTEGLSSKSKKLTERQFFTTPNTGLVNNQTEYAKTLYGQPNAKSCRENTGDCLGFL